MYIFQKREMQLTLAACSDRNVNVKRITERAVVLGGKAKVSMKKQIFRKKNFNFQSAVVDHLTMSDQPEAALKAALLVSEQNSEHAKSIIKLIATNMIAANKIEGKLIFFSFFFEIFLNFFLKLNFQMEFN